MAVAHQISPAEVEHTKFSKKPLLRPSQVETLENEIKVTKAMAENPIVQNKGQVLKQLAVLQHNYNTQVPKSPIPGSKEEALMVKRAEFLLSKIKPTMCSQQEMRQCPPGAIDKFMKGENSPEIKPMIAEWQNLMRRLHPGERDAANLEKHRPVESTLNLDNAIVQTKTYIMPPQNMTGNVVTFSDEQLQLLRLIDPDTADKLATMPNDLRGQIKNVVMQAQHTGVKNDDTSEVIQEPAAKPVAEIKPKKRAMTQKQKDALAKGRAKKAKKQKAQKATKAD